MKQSNVVDKTVFSTCLIGDRAKEGSELSFFTVPRGQYMPMAPNSANLCSKCNQPAGRFLTEFDTNVMQAGQLGSSIGDARFDRIRAQFVDGGDPVSLEGEVTLRVAGKTVLQTSLEKLVADWVQIEGELKMVEATPSAEKKRSTQKVPFCLVSRDDTVEARLRLNREAKIAGAAIAVRLSIEGKFITDRGSLENLPELVNAGRG
jgi:hypothetical protein